MQVVRAVQFSMDKFAVGWFAPGSTVGAFGVASRISQLGALPTVAITRITYPMFFAEGAAGLHSAMRLARRFFPAVIGVGLLSSAGLILVAFILPDLFGPAFAAARPFLLMMALLPLAAGLQNLAGDILSGADFQAQRLIAGIVGLALATGSSAIGGLTYGVSGAVFGYMIGQFLLVTSTWAMVAYLQRRAS
jgi:O-antigen/teichoic acid export membrane protein